MPKYQTRKATSRGKAETLRRKQARARKVMFATTVCN